jgi:hypothetical protein
MNNDPEKSADDCSPGDYPRFRSHYLPRTRDGWVAVLSFLGLFALTQPPFVHGIANRIAPWILGLPFLYAYLLILYVALIGVLIWAQRRGI